MGNFADQIPGAAGISRGALGRVTSPLRGVLDGGPGAVNGTTYNLRTNRYGLGSGVFSQGIPRAFEIGMRVSF